MTMGKSKKRNKKLLRQLVRALKGHDRPVTMKGRKIVARCPFHKEFTPSFHVFVPNGSYYCFGCHVQGGLFKHGAGEVIEKIRKADPQVYGQLDPGLTSKNYQSPRRRQKGEEWWQRSLKSK